MLCTHTHTTATKTHSPLSAIGRALIREPSNWYPMGRAEVAIFQLSTYSPEYNGACQLGSLALPRIKALYANKVVMDGWVLVLFFWSNETHRGLRRRRPIRICSHRLFLTPCVMESDQLQSERCAKMTHMERERERERWRADGPCGLVGRSIQSGPGPIQSFARLTHRDNGPVRFQSPVGDSKYGTRRCPLLLVGWSRFWNR